MRHCVAMAGHFDAIGLDIPDRTVFAKTLADMLRSGDRCTGPIGERILWQDESGAGVAMFTMDGQGECAKPTFAGRSRVVVRPTARVEDARGCRFCAIDHVEIRQDDQLVYPLGIELDDSHAGSLTAVDGDVSVALIAFAERLDVWEDIADFRADPKVRWPLGPHSVIPLGAFAPGPEARPPRAAAIITGVVVAADRLTNSRSGRLFDWCQLETLAMTIDVVAARQPAPFTAGQVVHGTFWIVGHRADPAM